MKVGLHQKTDLKDKYTGKHRKDTVTSVGITELCRKRIFSSEVVLITALLVTYGVHILGGTPTSNRVISKEGLRRG